MAGRNTKPVGNDAWDRSTIEVQLERRRCVVVRRQHFRWVLRIAEDAAEIDHTVKSPICANPPVDCLAHLFAYFDVARRSSVRWWSQRF